MTDTKTKYRTVTKESGVYTHVYVMPDDRKPERRPPMRKAKLAQAAQQPVEAKAGQAFAQRLRAILELPAARNKQRQALDIAAETRASVKEAAAILSTLGEDRQSNFPHGGTHFLNSTVTHDAEARRILSILRHAEAEGRESAALELATNTTLGLDQAVALLAGMPKVEHSRIPTIAERAAEGDWFGDDPSEPMARGRKADPWAEAIKNANATFTTAPKPAPATPIKETFK